MRGFDFSGAYAALDVGAHRVALLRDGGQAFAAMLRAIASAQSTICLETYILRDDKTGKRFANALIERARAGVEVNLIYDVWGSSVSASYLRQLHDAGVRTLGFHPIRFSGEVHRMFARFGRRDHRKALIVDSRVAFTGGMNIADDYAPREDGGAGWRDTHLGFEGPAARELEYTFLRTWKRSKGAAIDATRYDGDGRRADPKVRIASSDLRRGRNAIREAYREAISGAKERIYITNAYFLPTLRFLAALRKAANCGVDVRVILAGTTDVNTVLFAARSIYGTLLEAGVRLYEWRGRILHAKTAVVDGKWSTVGSSNLDHQSLRLNLEVNAVIVDHAFAGALERMFLEDLAESDEIELDTWNRRPPWQRALSWGAWLLRDWL